MKNLILFDDDQTWRQLLPITHTRPISEIRLGILTLKEKWEMLLDGQVSYVTQDYLSEKYSIVISDDNILINSSLVPNTKLSKYIEVLKMNEALMYRDELIAARLDNQQFDTLIKANELEEIHGIDISEEQDLIQFLEHPYQIFTMNEQEIEKDFQLLTKGRESQILSKSNTLLGTGRIFIEEGAVIECSILNTNGGSIYIGRDAEIMEGSMIRGPFALCEHSTVKMGAKIYGGVTIGPHSKVGGELGNSVILGYTNKGHDGYLGNSVLGEWCNLGADTNVSNLKNNYDEVKVWSYVSDRFEKTGQTFHGLIMGDHSKCGINTMFNTGTVVGVACNIFGDGYPRNFIPSFSWGGHNGFITHLLEKAFMTAEIVMNRRKLPLREHDKKILEYIFLQSARYRSWEK